MISRRDALLSTLFGTGCIGLRALATGLPASFLLNPRKALAQASMSPCKDKAQYIIFSTSGEGDLINTHAPGTYDDPLIVHSKDPRLAATSLTIGGQSHKAGAPWATLPQNVLDRTVFWHLMTNTQVHSELPHVLKLNGATEAREMLPSLLAKQLAPCLGTTQPQPITVGAFSPSEALSYSGMALPIIPPLALKATLANPMGPLSGLQSLCDSTLNKLYDLYKNGTTVAQKQYLDSLLTSQKGVRHIKQELLNALSTIKDNSPASAGIGRGHAHPNERQPRRVH